MLFLGLFYLQIGKYKLAEKYLLDSAKNNNTKSYDYLLYLYSKKNKNDEQRLKYLKLAVDAESSNGYCLMGLQCYMDDDNEKAKEYFLKAINKGNSDGLYYLGKYYYLMKKHNAPMMKKCLHLAIKYANDKDAIKFLIDYYSSIEYDLIKSRKYLTMCTTNSAMLSYHDYSGKEPNPYIDDDSECNYVFDNNILTQINMSVGTLNKYEFNDQDDNYFTKSIKML